MAKKYKCPYCEKRLIRKDLITHIDKSHKELIPENYTAARLVYNQVNKVDHGKCRVCGKPTAWSEKSGRYDVLCGDPKCKEHMREEYKKNMLRVKGTYNILNDPEQQKKMLANRSISGQYKFQDGGVLTYTGSYEKKCLEFMDVVMQIPSKDILSPGPTLEYEYNGEKHFYITDFYYIPYNLIIEVKDGGDNLNTKDSASMKASREKTIEKEHLITDRGEYNYIRLTNNNFAQLIEVFMIIKEKLLEGDDSKTYRINESQVVLENTNISDIRNVINKIYQKYLKDKKPPTGNQNCQLCTWCVESWFRGINVLPRPIYSPTDIAFEFNGYDIVKNPELIKFRSKEDFKRVIHSSGNGSRYYVHVKWNGGSGGHEFMAIDIDSIIYIIDAQQGIIENMDTSYAVKDYFNINYDESYMVRLDNKQFNKELLKYNNNKYIKQLTEDDMKMLEENAIDESLEDISGIIFGKRKIFQDEYITLYHGTDLGNLKEIIPNSYNAGLKNAKPKLSSYWFNNIEYATSFATMTFIDTNLSNYDMLLILDNDMKVLVEDKYQSKVINVIRGNKSYVYEKTIESSFVGYGHEGIFPEYTLDIPVKPDHHYIVSDKQMLSYVKFVSEDYIKSIKQKYKDNKMVFNSNPLQQGINKMLYYDGVKYRVAKIKKAKSYNESCELSSSNTGIINPQWKIFADYMCTKYKVNNSIKINIKFLHSKASFDMMSNKYNGDANTNATIRNGNTIYVLDEDIYNNLYHDNYNNIVRYEIAWIILSKYYNANTDRTIEAICVYESGMLDEFEAYNTGKIKRAKKYKEYLDANGIAAVMRYLTSNKAIIN